MREIILDTETTGLELSEGHRIVEIGAVVLRDGMETGERFQTYLNPERSVSEAALGVHGLSDSFLKDKPFFRDIADRFLAFIGKERLVMHNAPFDLGFLNAELESAGKPLISEGRVLDTLLLARAKWPGAGASLEALCKRFRIDDSARLSHGALLDAELLARVYQALTNVKRQGQFALASAGAAAAGGLGAKESALAAPATAISAAVPSRRRRSPTAEEAAAHRRFLESLSASPLWSRL